jgi:hypothetical protein
VDYNAVVISSTPESVDEDGDQVPEQFTLRCTNVDNENNVIRESGSYWTLHQFIDPLTL